MELKCPQCGKWMAVSQEELVIHDCQVVCPQCLAVCSYEGGVLVVRDDSDAPYRHTAPAAETQPAASRFCHSCGKQLPEGISFCPYCGADLKAPFNGKEPAAVEVTVPKPEPTHTVPVTTGESADPVIFAVLFEGFAPTRQDLVRIGLVSHVPHHLVVGGVEDFVDGYGDFDGTEAGTLFKVVAYTIIIALIALLIYIIAAGLSIEPTA